MANKPVNKKALKSWKCSKCGYVVNGPIQPVKCPKCKNSGGVKMLGEPVPGAEVYLELEPDDEP
jgi:ABC-type ATPase with predicted acetyltransferase domain